MKTNGAVKQHTSDDVLRYARRPAALPRALPPASAFSFARTLPRIISRRFIIEFYQWAYTEPYIECGLKHITNDFLPRMGRDGETQLLFTSASETFFEQIG